MNKEEISAARVGGVFAFEHVRDGKVIDKWEEKNIVVDEGLTDMLEVNLGNGTMKASWFVGLFEGNYTPVATDTAANITANATECTAYDEAARVAWACAAAAAKVITNSASKATFTMNATKTVYGAFLVSASAKSATTGVLFSATKFATPRAVIDNDQLLVTYTVTAASA